MSTPVFSAVDLHSMIFSLPMTIVTITQIADIMVNALFTETVAELPDFDLVEVITEEGERLHLLQGALTGAGMLFRVPDHGRVQVDAQAEQLPPLPPLPPLPFPLSGMSPSA